MGRRKVREEEQTWLRITDHGPNVKDDERYEKLREKGESKDKAARIANTSRSRAGKRGGKSGSYEDWSKQELQERAKEIGIEGRSNSGFQCG